MAPNRRRRVGPVPRRMEDTSVWPEDHLAGLVEATSDQVSLGPLAIPAEAFDEVLAEAQAALTRERERQRHRHSTRPCRLRDPQTVATEEPGVSEHQPVPPDGGQAEGPPNRREDAIAPRRPESPDGGERPDGGTTRQEGDPTQGEGQDARHQLRGPARRRRTDSAVDRRAFRT